MLNRITESTRVRRNEADSNTEAGEIKNSLKALKGFGFMNEQHIKLPEGSIEKRTTTLNLGPTHPATHGVMQNILELDGERIVSTEQTIGYIHRAFEKNC